jgi:hypothetical protein
MEDYIAPCGVCRQMLAEFDDGGMRVILARFPRITGFTRSRSFFRWLFRGKAVGERLFQDDEDIFRYFGNIRQRRGGERIMLKGMVFGPLGDASAADTRRRKPDAHVRHYPQKARGGAPFPARRSPILSTAPSAARFPIISCPPF